MDWVTIPKGAEHAIKVLICLALSVGRPVPASQVARCVRLSASQAAKTLHFLRWAGLARSRRGPLGGYSLRKPPEEIRIGQVIELFRLAPDDEAASNGDPLHRIWSETAAQTEKEWEQLTVAELARRTRGLWECPECNDKVITEGNLETAGKNLKS